jgi:Tfp pilus assembly protein PilF
MRSRSAAFYLACALLISLCCSPHVSAQNANGTILGRVRVAPGTDLPRPVLVTIDTHGAIVSSTYTDAEGQFWVNGLLGNVYHVNISDDDYLPYSESVPIDPAVSAVRSLNIYLTRKPGKEPDKTDSVAGGNPNLVDLSEYTKKAPKKARKEFDSGVEADKKKKLPDAIKHYQNALAIAPDFYPAHNNLGIDLLSLKQYEQAQAQFEAAVKVNPSDASAYFNLGNLFYLTNSFATAKDWVDRGLSRQPDSALGHFIEGALFTQAGKLHEAEITFRRCLELSPIMAKAHLALANLYLQQHRKDEAIAELKVFVTSFPADPNTTHAKEVLQKLGATADASR